MDSNEKDQKNASANKSQDCLSCRIIGSTGMLLCSLYVLTRGATAKNLSTKVSSLLFGSSLGYTGLARALDWYPFKMEEEMEVSSK